MADYTIGYTAAGAAQDYTTIAGFNAIAANTDRGLLWYSTANKGLAYYEATTITVGLTLEGALASQQVAVIHSGPVFTCNADIGAGNTITITNLSLSCTANGNSVLHFNNVRSGVMNRCRIDSAAQGVNVFQGTVTVNMCHGSNCQYPFTVVGAGGTLTLNNCTAARNRQGFKRSNGTMNVYNCAAWGNASNGFAGIIAAGTNNASDDSTHPATNGLDISSSDPKFVMDNSNGNFVPDWRVVSGSALLGAGTDRGLTVDIDNQSVDQGVSADIGCSTGIAFVTAVSSSSSSSSSTAAQNSSSSSSSSSTASSSSVSQSSASSNDTVNEWSNLSNVVLAEVTDGTSIGDTEEELYIREHGQSMTVQTRSVTNVNGERQPSWANASTIFGWKQPVSGSTRVQYARRELVVTHSVFFADDPSCTEGDRITIGSKNHMVRGCKPNTKDAVGADRLWRVDVEELL